MVLHRNPAATAQIALLCHKVGPELGAAIRALQETGKIADILEAHGLDRSGAETGEPRRIEQGRRLGTAGDARRNGRLGRRRPAHQRDDSTA